MTMLQWIRHWSETCPDRAAHVSGGRSLTYRELWERSDALAALLLERHGRDGRPVVVRGHKEPEMLVAFLAAVKAGRPYVPVDLSIPQDRFERIAAAAGACEVLQAAGLPEPAPGRTPDPGAAAGPADPFYIIFTSGSTGEPKGVPITLANLMDFVTWMLGEQQIASMAETFLNQAPFSFDLSVMDLYLSLATGGTLFSLEKALAENPRELFKALASSGVTTWVSTPSFAVMCLAERSFGQAMLPGLRRFLFCGETLPADCAARLLERFPQAEVWNTYGPTEATVATTSVRVDRALVERCNPLPVGRPKPGTRVLVMDAEGRPVPAGERGEIVIAGPNVSQGYLNNPERSAQSFFRLDGLQAYRTGDWGRFQDGLLYCEGRMDFQVKLHGYRIELGDIESHLRALHWVEDAVVLPAIRDGRVQWLGAFVILSERPGGSDFAVAQLLRQALGARLPAYMLPRKFYFIDAFPMTPNGKADRRALGERLT